MITKSQNISLFLGAPFAALSILWMASILPISPIYACIIPFGLAILYIKPYRKLKFETYCAYGAQLLFFSYLMFIPVLNVTTQHEAYILIFALSFYITTDYMLSTIKDFDQIKKVMYLFFIVGILYLAFDLVYRVKHADTTNIPSWIANRPIFFFYLYKDNGIHGDSNATGIVCTVLLALCYYYKSLFTRKSNDLRKCSLIYFILFLLMIFTFCRSCWVAFVLFFIIQLFSRQNLYIKFFGIIVIIFGIFYAISIFLADPSFLTKVKIFDKTLFFLQTAKAHDLLFGVGANHSSDVIGFYAHNFLSVYIIEYGLVGFFLYVMMFVFIYFDVGKKSLIIYIPYFINALSYSPLHISYVFAALALMKHCERLKPVNRGFTKKNKKHINLKYLKYSF